MKFVSCYSNRGESGWLSAAFVSKTSMLYCCSSRSGNINQTLYVRGKEGRKEGRRDEEEEEDAFLLPLVKE
jgi:hypothetical protein